MKKVLTIILAAVMVLSCSMTAFASITICTDAGTESKKGDYTHQGDAKSVAADDANDTLEVTGNITGNNDTNSVFANFGAKITVDGKVKDTNDDARYYAVKANSDTSVNIKKDVEEEGNGDAIYAYSATVKIDGNVKEYGYGDAINASKNSTVEVEGNVEENGYGYAIQAASNSTVKVGGYVEGKDGNDAIYASDATTVIVEGTVKGNITTYGSGNVYIGEFEGTTGNLDNIHYLIGTAADSATLGNIKVENNGVLAEGGQGFATVEGVTKEGTATKYFYTAASDFSEAKTITLKSNDSSKKLEISGLPTAGVSQKTDESTGAITLTLNGDFKGGLQNLILTLKDIIYDIFVNNDGNGSATSNPTQGAQGTAVDLTATANDKYEFDYWEVVSGNVTIDNNKFNIGTEDVVIKAHFKEVQQPNPKKQTSSSTIFTGTTGNPVTNGKWTKNADGTWSYATSRKFTNTWGYIANPNDAGSAAWYYFDGNGNMLTGWQKLYWNGAYRWYYFSQTKDSNEGKCQLGGITPDGYKVGPDGAWIED